MSRVNKKKLPNDLMGTEVRHLKKQDAKFELVLSESLTNGYEFSDMKTEDIKQFHYFLKETVYKDLSLTQVEKLFRRKGEEEFSEGELIHFGKDSTAFRIFGYYNDALQFVVKRIDPHHRTHRST